MRPNENELWTGKTARERILGAIQRLQVGQPANPAVLSLRSQTTLVALALEAKVSRATLYLPAHVDLTEIFLSGLEDGPSATAGLSREELDKRLAKAERTIEELRYDRDRYRGVVEGIAQHFRHTVDRWREAERLLAIANQQLAEAGIETAKVIPIRGRRR